MNNPDTNLSEEIHKKEEKCSIYSMNLFHEMKKNVYLETHAGFLSNPLLFYNFGRLLFGNCFLIRNYIMHKPREL